jgi:uncharacterized membrane protein YphA (DoxX/SURF4 family)
VPAFLLDPVGRYVLASAFLMAALTKFADLTGFRERLVLHSGLPLALAVGLAYFLPALELTCGFCLILGIARREAALLTALLLMSFLAYSFTGERAMECGCFLFPTGQPWLATGWAARLRDFVLLFASLGITCRRRRD